MYEVNPVSSDEGMEAQSGLSQLLKITHNEWHKIPHKEVNFHGDMLDSNASNLATGEPGMDKNMRPTCSLTFHKLGLV